MPLFLVRIENMSSHEIQLNSNRKPLYIYDMNLGNSP